MPPVNKSRRVLPADHCAITIAMSGPMALHPPSFNFAVASADFGDVGTAVGLWLGHATVGFLANLHIDYSVERLILRTSTGTAEVATSSPGGLIGVDLVTPAVSMLVKATTEAAGRRGSGRMYWPGVLGDGDVDNAGRIETGRLGEIQDCCDDLFDTLEAASLVPVLLHSYSWPYGDADPGPPVDFPDPTPVTAFVGQSVVATQRRRQR
jgi:hypothetical protein